MCRMLIYVGEPILLADILTTPTHSILKQCFEHYLPLLEHNWNLSTLLSHAKRNHVVNADGFGVAWFTTHSHEPCLFSGTDQPWANVNLLRLSESTLSRLVFAHVRAASPGLPIVETNCHPFVFGPIVWMHNGTIPGFKQCVRSFLALLSQSAFELIRGTTDSEVAGALFVDILHNSTPDAPWDGVFLRSYSPIELCDAMEETVCTILRVSREARDGSACSLNFAVTDGFSTVCSRFRNSAHQDPPSLYFSVGNQISLAPSGVFDCPCGRDDDVAEVGPLSRSTADVEILASDCSMKRSMSHQALSNWEECPALRVRPVENADTSAEKGEEEKDDLRDRLFVPGRRDPPRTLKHKEFVIVASEPITYEERCWQLIPKNHLICITTEQAVFLRRMHYIGWAKSMWTSAVARIVFQLRAKKATCAFCGDVMREVACCTSSPKSKATMNRKITTSAVPCSPDMLLCEPCNEVRMYRRDLVQKKTAILFGEH